MCGGDSILQEDVDQDRTSTFGKPQCSSTARKHLGVWSMQLDIRRGRCRSIISFFTSPSDQGKFVERRGTSHAVSRSTASRHLWTCREQGGVHSVRVPNVLDSRCLGAASDAADLSTLQTQCRDLWCHCLLHDLIRGGHGTESVNASYVAHPLDRCGAFAGSNRSK
ncbi:hypothetical protein MRB53_041635 [Persea americana]|nr:hypothetical protein MRB53_041635 [Persea americana]